MKNIFIKNMLLGLMLSILVSNIDAQLRVESTGMTKFNNNIAIGTTTVDSIRLRLYKRVIGTTYPYVGVYSRLKAASTGAVGSCYAIFGHADASVYTVGSDHYLDHAVGVWGAVTNNQANASSIFCVGVAGSVNQSYSNGGIGIYGTIKQGYTFPSGGNSGLYAGYFNGPVQVTSSMTAASYATTSDVRLKQRIEPLEAIDASTALMQLRPISYYFKHDKDSMQYVFGRDSKAMETKHFGLVAQDVQQILPNIVYENCDGYLAVNYTELIPLLIKKIQELSAEVEELKNANRAQLPAYKSNFQKSKSTRAVLYPNTPNPFGQNTTIGYYLPEDTHEATIRIYDMNGTEFVAFPIDTFGQGELTIDGGTLRAGMYLYSLIADGQLVDTKQMILTK